MGKRGPELRTLTLRARLTHVSSAGAMIIERFDMQAISAGALIYEGDTTFGFFTVQKPSPGRRASGIVKTLSTCRRPRSLKAAFPRFFQTGRRFFRRM